MRSFTCYETATVRHHGTCQSQAGSLAGTPDGKDVQVNPRLSFSPDRLKHHRARSGMSQAGLAAKLREMTGTTTVSANYVYRWESGLRTPDDWLVALALALEVEVNDLCETVPDPAGRSGHLQSAGHGLDQWGQVSEVLRRSFLARGLTLAALPPVIRALDVIGDGNLGTVTDGLGELVDHYTQSMTILAPDRAYDEVLAVRAYAGTVLDRAHNTSRSPQLALICGWLSGLLAVAAHDMGEHATARLWCSDAERRSEDARHPELAGWAYLTRAMIAHYQRLPNEAAALAAKGQHIAPIGTVAHAKLAAHQMRASAMAGDAQSSAEARQHATVALRALPANAPTTGVYSIALAEDPPYTATSLLLAGQYREAAAATERVIQTCYRSESRQQGGNPSGYARSLLILGLAHAGTGEIDQAASAGLAALDSNRHVWPTMTLAAQLERSLSRTDSSQMARQYGTRYREVADQLANARRTTE
ncbi:helix-turn-helix domain-containing protein [Streptosporangium sp. NPDC000509]|uniref:helix-turn-helix domain-containing protein n=1 Tax=Streptosporangium sp. NPDC000509 TaxID=3366186 RepID=UPI0036ABFB74